MSFEVQKLTNIHLDMIIQLIITNQEAIRKDLEIKNLKLQNEQLKNELKYEKELMESLNKPNEAIKHFEDMVKSLREKDISRLGCKQSSTNEEGESSKSGELRNAKTKGKPTCYYCGNFGHTTNICKRKNDKKTPISKRRSNYSKCKKLEHQGHECKTMNTDSTRKASRFQGHYYNCKKYGHKTYE